MAKYWKTLEYLGAGFVLQRKVDSDGVPIEQYKSRNSDGWKNGSPWNRPELEARRFHERIIHVNETDIEVEVSDEMLTELS